MEENRVSLAVRAGRVLGSRLFLLLVGGAIALLFAPRTGRSSRAWLRQRYDSLMARMRRGEREILRWQSYEKGKATGVIHDLRERFARRAREVEQVDDDIITSRVRTTLGENRLTWHLPKLNIDTVNGLVTLRGHLPSQRDVQAVEHVTKRVPGVRKVVNKVTFSLPEARRAAAEM